MALLLKENYGMDKMYYVTCVFTESLRKMLRNDPKVERKKGTHWYIKVFILINLAGLLETKQDRPFVHNVSEGVFGLTLIIK